MNQAIVISENKLLSELIKLNLSAFYNYHLVQVDSIQKFQDLIAKGCEFDLVIAHTTLGHSNVVQHLSELCFAHLPKSNVIFLGHTDFILMGQFFHIIQRHNDVQTLMALLSQLFHRGVLPQPKKNHQEYFPVPAYIVSQLKIARQDYWLRDELSDDLILVIEKGRYIPEILASKSIKSSDQFFVLSEFKEFVILSLTREILESLSAVSAIS